MKIRSPKQENGCSVPWSLLTQHKWSQLGSKQVEWIVNQNLSLQLHICTSWTQGSERKPNPSSISFCTKKISHKCVHICHLVLCILPRQVDFYIPQTWNFLQSHFWSELEALDFPFLLQLWRRMFGFPGGSLQNWTLPMLTMVGQLLRNQSSKRRKKV